MGEQVAYVEDKISQKDDLILQLEKKKKRKFQYRKILRLESDLCNIKVEHKRDSVFESTKHTDNSVLNRHYNRYGNC